MANEVNVGDQFRDNDTRTWDAETRRNELLTVVATEGDQAIVRRHNSGRRTRISLRRLANDRSSRGYTPVESADA